MSEKAKSFFFYIPILAIAWPYFQKTGGEVGKFTSCALFILFLLFPLVLVVIINNLLMTALVWSYTAYNAIFS